MELETIIWCPKCQVDKYQVRRQRVREDVYTHVILPPDADKKLCKECGQNLERHVQ